MTETSASDGVWTAAVPSRTTAVLEALKHAILSGRFLPGQALVENELAQALGVSKTPVREALKTLAGTGLVTMSPYKGAVVRTIDADFARALYDMRLMLEPEAGRRAVAATRGTAAPGTAKPGLAAASAALEAADRAADQADRSLANRDFHRALYLDCGNAILVKVLDELRDQTALVSTVGWSHTATWEQEAREHRDILEAAEAGDGAAVEALLRAHIAGFMERNFPRDSHDADD